MIHRSNNTKALPVNDGTNTTERVVNKVTKYTTLAAFRDSWNIFLNCAFGPVRKNEPLNATRFPTVYINTNGLGFPKSSSCV